MTESQEMTVIERAARAIYDAEDSQSGDTIGTVIWNSEHLFCDSIEGEEIVDKAWRASRPVCLDAARAVLQAIREPTPEMVEAGMDYDERELNIRLGRPPTVEECQAGEWQAMIDAALSE